MGGRLIDFYSLFYAIPPGVLLTEIPIIILLHTTNQTISSSANPNPTGQPNQTNNDETALPVLLAAQALRTLAMVHAASSFSHEVSRGAKADDHTLVTRGVYQ